MSKYAISVEAKDQNQAGLIENALKDKKLRAFVIIVGALVNLPTKRTQERVLRFAVDHIQEQQALAESEKPND